MTETVESPKLGTRFQAALAVASEWHWLDTRKGTGVPYVSHLLGVCALVLEDGGDEEDAIAGLLHDAVEDAPDDVERARRRTLIRGWFGDVVLQTVEACSDSDATPRPPWQQRKEAHLRHLREHGSTRIYRVLAADKLYNSRAIVSDYRRLGEDLWSRFTASGEQTLWYYGEMVKLLTAHHPSPASDELERTVAELRRLVALNRPG